MPSSNVHGNTAIVATVVATVVAALFSATPLAAQARQGLYNNQFLVTGEFLQSPNRGFYAILQADGNFVVYKGPDPSHSQGYLWGTQRTGTGRTFYAMMQQDGNFCVYEGTPSARGHELWCSSGRPPGNSVPYSLKVQNDGNLIIWREGEREPSRGTVWASNVTSAPPPPLAVQSARRQKLVSDFFDYGLAYISRRAGDPMELTVVKSADANAWIFPGDGTMRSAMHTDQCLAIPAGALQMKMQTCTGSAVQTAWRYSATDRTVRNTQFPAGCLRIDAGNGGETAPFMSEKSCWLKEEGGLSPADIQKSHWSLR